MLLLVLILNLLTISSYIRNRCILSNNLRRNLRMFSINHFVCTILCYKI